MKNYYNILFPLLIALFVLSCDKEVFNGPQNTNVQYGKLFIDSNPQEALIYIEGKNTGYFTPDTLTWLEAGRHNITLIKGFYGDSTFTVEIKADDKKEILIDLKNDARNGFLYCSSKPDGAQIYINDVNTNQITPYFFAKPPGIYELKYSYPSYRADSIDVTLYAKQNKYVNLALEDTSVWVGYNVSNSEIPDNQITSIAVDKNNIKWIGTSNKGISKFDEKVWTYFTVENSSLISDIINCINVTNDNSIWIGTAKGLSVYKDGIWSTFGEDFLNKNINDISNGLNNEIWLATDVGLVKYSAGSWTLYNKSNAGINENMITCVEVDNSGRVWFGTYMSGVYMYDGTNWISHNVGPFGGVEESMTDFVSCLAIDGNNDIWVERGVVRLDVFGNTTTFLLTKYDGTSWQAIFLPVVDVHDITSIYIDKDNNRWFGTTKGLFAYLSTGAVVGYTINNSPITTGKINSITSDNENNIWFATVANGIMKFKRK